MSRDVVLMEGWFEFYPYSYLFLMADTSFQTAREGQPGRNHHLVSAVVFSAFAVEAAGNHIGIDHVPNWIDAERGFGGWKKKLEHLAVTFSVNFDWTTRPGKTVEEVFRVRHNLAHGMTWRGTGSYREDLERADGIDFPSSEPDWLLPCFNEQWVSQAVDDAREFVRQLLPAAKYPPPELDLSKMGHGAFHQAEDPQKQPGMTWKKGR